MFQPLHNSFHKAQLPWDEQDLKYAIQDWLRQEVGSDQILCQSVSGGVVAIRVVAPSLRQEVGLLEYDLTQFLKDRFDYQLKNIVITQR